MTDYTKIAEDALAYWGERAASKVLGELDPAALARVLVACDRERQEAERELALCQEALIAAALAAEDKTPDPACPSCGMTAQVEPSRKEPGKYMCHGCAQTFIAGDKT